MLPGGHFPLTALACNLINSFVKFGNTVRNILLCTLKKSEKELNLDKARQRPLLAEKRSTLLGRAPYPVDQVRGEWA